MTAKELELKSKKEIETKGEKTYACKIYSPDVDIYENEHEIVLEVDVNLKLEDNVLHIDAKVVPGEYEGLKPLYGEYNIGHYQREFRIGELVDQNKIDACVNNGVLKINLPKTERAKPRQISIQ